jgi:hypothetical protein
VAVGSEGFANGEGDADPFLWEAATAYNNIDCGEGLQHFSIRAFDKSQNRNSQENRALQTIWLSLVWLLCENAEKPE